MKNNSGIFRFTRILAFLLVLFLLPSFAFGSGMEVEEVDIRTPSEYALPIDFSPGLPLKQDGWSESKDESGNPVRTYEDSTIKAVLYQIRWYIPGGRDKQGTTVWIADVTISDPSQLRVASYDGPFEKPNQAGDIAVAAERMNAVVAVDGDSWGAQKAEKHNLGIVFRQGKLIEKPEPRLDDSGKFRMDLLLIDMEGNFHGIHAAQKGDLDDPSSYDGCRIMDVFTFGPILVEDGQALTDYQGTDKQRGYKGGCWIKMLSDETAQRAAICQVGPLHYMLVVSEKYYENRGLTIPEFAECLAAQGVQFAYNLDGGQSSILYWPGAGKNKSGKVNVPKLDNRPLWDFIYFASAEKE